MIIGRVVEEDGVKVEYRLKDFIAENPSLTAEEIYNGWYAKLHAVRARKLTEDKWSELNDQTKIHYSHVIGRMRLLSSSKMTRTEVFQISLAARTGKSFIKASPEVRSMIVETMKSFPNGCFASQLYEKFYKDRDLDAVPWEHVNDLAKKWWMEQLIAASQQILLEESLNEAKCTLEEMNVTMSLQRRPHEYSPTQVLQRSPDHTSLTAD